MKAKIGDLLVIESNSAEQHRRQGEIVEVRGAWFEGDLGWYRFVSDALFVQGASRPPADLLETFLGGPLTAEPLLADLGRGS